MNIRTFRLRAALLRIVLVVPLVLGSSLLSPERGSAQGAADYRPYALRHVAAQDAAPQVQQILSDVGGGSEMLIDRGNNRLLVRTTPDGQRLVGQLLQTIDRAPAAPAAPAESSRVVRGYPVPAAELEQRAADLQRRMGPSARVVADPRTNQLVVLATAEVHQQIAAVLQPNRGAEPATQPAARPQVQATGDASRGAVSLASAAPGYQLKNVSWRELEDTLRRVWGPALTVNTDRNGELAQLSLPVGNALQPMMEIDRRHDYVRFQGDRRLQAAWSNVIAALDGRQSGDATSVIPLKQADPSRVEQAAQLLRTAVPAASTAAATAAMGLNYGPLQNRDGNRLVAMVFQEGEAGGQAPAQPQPGQPQPQPGQPQPQPGQQEAAPVDASPIGDVKIQVVPDLGVVVVSGNPRDVERVKRIIDEIVQQSTQVRPEVALIPLEHINNQTAGQLLQQVYDQVFEARQGPLSITPLDKPNAILAIGTKENIQLLQELLKKLDLPVDPATQMRVFQLKHLSATNAEQLVRNFFTQIPRGGTNVGADVTADQLRQGLGTRLRIVSDYRSNSLIVQASPRDLEEIAHLIEQIDVERTEAENELRVFRLQNALADELAPVLQEAISGQSADQQQAQQQGVQTQVRPSTRLSIIGVDRQGNKIIDSGILSDVSVVADANVNALIVRAPSKSMPLVEELIRQLDQLPNAEAQIKVFRIENGDATQLTALLQSLFGQTVTAGQGNLTQTVGQLGQAFGTAAGAGESSLVALRFAVDVRTNSIIVSGSRADLEVVELLLIRLDESEIETRKLLVYRLKNAPALDVANSLLQFLDRQSQLISLQQQSNQAVSAFQQIDQEVIVVPELVSNSLIISATPRYYTQILDVIKDLDYRPSMVMVQVVIAEVELDDLFEFGVEWGLQDSLLFDRSVVNGTLDPGFNFNNAPLGNSSSAASLATRGTVAAQGLSAFGLGRSSATAGFGGLVLSAASDSVNALVRALQLSNRLQILSRPQIMTLDNQVGFVQVGANVPRITGSTITQFGTQNQTTDVPVGLLLRIQPRINEDGLVTMNIDAERSRVGEAADGIPIAIDQNGNVINSPQIDITTAQTTVSAYSGQTVVFGGLISKDRAITTRKIPYLGDIPVLGRLFRFDVEAERRRELLVFMTPRIVNDDEDYDWINFTESDRMSWCLADVVEMHGNVGMSGGHGLWGPARAPTIYPVEQPYAVSEQVVEGSVSEYPSYSSPQQMVPQQGVPQQMVPQQMVPQQMVPQQPIPPQSGPQIVPGDSAPVQTLPNETTRRSWQPADQRRLSPAAANAAALQQYRGGPQAMGSGSPGGQPWNAQQPPTVSPAAYRVSPRASYPAPTPVAPAAAVRQTSVQQRPVARYPGAGVSFSASEAQGAGGQGSASGPRPVVQPPVHAATTVSYTSDGLPETLRAVNAVDRADPAGTRGQVERLPRPR